MTVLSSMIAALASFPSWMNVPFVMNHVSKVKSKNVPRKTFKYLPLEIKICRLFANKTTSCFIQLHRNSAKVTQTVSSIHESPAWSEWYGSGGSYNSDPRALTFAICLDGLNPFKKENASYSMCPILLSPLNFPYNNRISQQEIDRY